jgi:hypothetical protein
VEINWGLLQPVDTGAAVQQGFATGMALVRHAQTQHALQSYLANPESDQAYNALATYDPNAAATIQHQQLVRHQLAMQADQEAQTRAIGMRAASGDVSGARNDALAAGNFDLLSHLEKMDDDSRGKVAAFYKAAAPIAYQMRQTKDPAQRKALLEAARPQLLATGVSPDAIDNFDVSNDQALDGLIAANSTVDQLIERGRITWHQQGEQPSFATNYMGEPIGSQNPYRQGASPSPQPAPAAQGGFDAAVAHVLGNEGGYSASDMNGAPVNFGINQGANPDVDVSKLTRDQARQIYHDRYWVPSGAEKLPPNMQAPYFDVYIRNPKIAKEALDASGGDPQKFVELTSGYFQHLGTTEKGKKYAKAWANRDRKNLEIATGGNVQPSDGTPHITSEADFNDLPHGATFIAPDGSRRVKP